MMQPRIQVEFPIGYRRAFRKKSPVYQPKAGEFLLNHNRSGLLIALRALQLSPGSEVGVMAYNCHTVMNAVEQAGYKVVFIDVTMELTMDLDDLRRKGQGLSALVVTHLFGIANDVDAIRLACPGIPVIEDCAHAYGMDSCGLKGDFASYSIGVGKYPSIGDGGILKVNNLGYMGAIERQLAQIQCYSWMQESRLFMKLVVSHWLYRPVLYSIVTLPLLKRGNRKVASAKENILPLKMSAGISAIYERVLPKIEAQLRCRQAVAESWAVYFSNREDCHSINLDLRNSNCFMFPLYCESPVRLKKEMRSHGIEAETHFRHCIEWCKAYGYRDGECPQAEHLVNHLLMIPTYKEMKL